VDVWLDTVVLGTEEKSVAKLQEERSVRKIYSLCDFFNHYDYAGLTADARIVINRARMEHQSRKLIVEDPVTVHCNLPFLFSTFLVCWACNTLNFLGCQNWSACSQLYTQGKGSPKQYQTDPSGAYHPWKPNVICHNAKTVQEFLEKNHTEEATATDKDTIKLMMSFARIAETEKEKEESEKKKKKNT
uniref:Proteasome 20S subunit alpha 8 n=1 Tax=Apteryx owenii TaxID=8824 RepID=A0A8B9NZ54_APTOW